MKNKNVSYDTTDIRNEAFSWIAQLETGELSPEDLAAFEEWIGRSPRHYSEIRQLAEMSKQVNSLADLSGALKVEKKQQKGFVRKVGLNAIKWRNGILAAGLAMCALGVTWNLNTEMNSPTFQLATQVGGVEETALLDGSSVKLNTNSEIEVEFDETERRIFLHKGEAFFDVAHDPEKPFSVYVEGRRITAVGTAFAVRKSANGLTVTVTEGKVALGRIGNENSVLPHGIGELEKLGDVSEHLKGQIISAGQKVKYSGVLNTPIVEELTPKDMSRQLSWRAGFLEFDKMRLIDVVEEMQRYTSTNIKLEDQELGELKFGGVFKAGETDAFFEALEYSFNIDVVRNSDLVVISRKESQD